MLLGSIVLLGRTMCCYGQWYVARNNGVLLGEQCVARDNGMLLGRTVCC